MLVDAIIGAEHGLRDGSVVQEWCREYCEEEQCIPQGDWSLFWFPWFLDPDWALLFIPEWGCSLIIGFFCGSFF